MIGGLWEVLRGKGSPLPRRLCSASTAASNRSNSWSVSCFIPLGRSFGSRYRGEEAQEQRLWCMVCVEAGLSPRRGLSQRRRREEIRFRLSGATVHHAVMMPPPTSWSNTIAAFDQSKWLYLKTRVPRADCVLAWWAALILMVYEALVLDVRVKTGRSRSVPKMSALRL